MAFEPNLLFRAIVAPNVNFYLGIGCREERKCVAVGNANDLAFDLSKRNNCRKNKKGKCYEGFGLQGSGVLFGNLMVKVY